MTLTRALLIIGWAAAASAAVGRAAGSRLPGQIDQILARRSLRRASVGVHVVRLDTGEEVYSRNAAKPLIPASNTKIFTSAAAIVLLGADFQFTTLVLRDGPIGANGVLRGNIIVKGDGDPNVSGRYFDGNVTAVLEQCAEIIKQQGVRQVTGDVVGDDRVFDRDYLRPKTSRYTSAVCGLPFNDNRIHVLVRPARPGAAASVTLEPSTQYVPFDHQIQTRAGKRTAEPRFRFTSDDNTIQGYGYVSAKAPQRRYRIGLQDPSLYFATVLTETLRTAGIEIHGRPRWPRDGATHAGAAELAKIVAGLDITLPVLDKGSNNFYADTLFKRIGAKVAGQGSFKSGGAAVSQFLRAIAAPNDRAAFSDGCGLSRDNVASVRTIVHVLCYMAASDAADLFKGSLAVAGLDGTLSQRLTKAPYRGKVQAKTGNIRGVSALSGYAEARSGATYAFSILINDSHTSNGQMKAVQDAIVRAIIDKG